MVESGRHIGFKYRCIICMREGSNPSGSICTRDGTGINIRILMYSSVILTRCSALTGRSRPFLIFADIGNLSDPISKNCRIQKSILMKQRRWRADLLRPLLRGELITISMSGLITDSSKNIQATAFLSQGR